MKLMDMCFEMCKNAKEDECIISILEVFTELRERAHRIIKIEKGKENYILNHPILPVKEMNSRVAYEAFGGAEVREYELFRAKAKSVSRIASYMHRFWIPNQRSQGNTLTFRGRQIRYQPVYEMLLAEVWGEPPQGTYLQ